MTDINPFLDTVVTEPREIEPPVAGLNDAPLARLMAAFSVLERGPRPRRIPAPPGALVTSPQPGYGKSHLIGRLFRELGQRATRIYVQPFQTVTSCWRSLLLHTMQELERPELAPGGAGRRDNHPLPSQLEVFAHGVLAHLFAGYLEGTSIPGKTRDNIQRQLQEDPVNAYRLSRRYKSWNSSLGKMIAAPKGLQKLARLLHPHMPTPSASAESWLRVLHHIALGGPDSPLQQSAREWLRGESVEQEEAAALGVRHADRPRYDLSEDAANQLAFNRLLDLCQLAGFYRPFLFCFDQTETYGDRPELARTLGQVVQELVNRAPNAMMLVTANVSPWQATISPHWEEAARNRLALPAIELHPLTREQGGRLLDQRLRRYPGAERSIHRAEWLQRLFRDQAEWGVRAFLQRCAGLWRGEEETPPSPPPADALERAYQARCRLLENEPHALLFNPDPLLWLVGEVAPGVAGLTVERKGSNGVVFWQAADGARLRIALESGSHHLRWRNLARMAVQARTTHPQLTHLYLRTAEQPPIPGPTWNTIGPEIRQALGAGLAIRVLTAEELVPLHAAWTLYADAAQGDLEFPTEAVKGFLATRLSAFWQALLGAGGKTTEPGPEPPPPPPQVVRGADGQELAAICQFLRQLMQRDKVLDLDQVMSQVGGRWPREAVVQAREGCGDIHLISNPEKVLWLWMGE